MTATPAAPPAAIPNVKADAAKAASALRAEGTMTVDEWSAVLEAVASAIDERNAECERRRGAAKRNRWLIVAAAVIAGIVAGVATKEPVAGFGVAIVGIVAAFFVVKLPPLDLVGIERPGFVRALLVELARIAPQGRVALAAQLDSRRAIDATPLPGSGPGTSRRSREDAWLRGELLGLQGLYLGWSVTEWHTLSRMRKKNARGRVKNKAKLVIARRYSVRVDADRRLFDAAATRAGATRLPDGLIEVRETPRAWSLRARQDFNAKLQLQDPDDLGASLAALREGAGHQGQDRADYFGQFASTLIHLMKQCEKQLAPRQPKKEAA